MFLNNNITERKIYVISDCGSSTAEIEYLIYCREKRYATGRKATTEYKGHAASNF